MAELHECCRLKSSASVGVDRRRVMYLGKPSPSVRSVQTMLLIMTSCQRAVFVSVSSAVDCLAQVQLGCPIRNMGQFGDDDADVERAIEERVDCF